MKPNLVKESLEVFRWHQQLKDLVLALEKEGYSLNDLANAFKRNHHLTPAQRAVLQARRLLGLPIPKG